jgi:hypothetical protein
VDCTPQKGGRMAKTSQERVKQLRERRKKSGGRSLSCWIELDTARKLDRIKEMTGSTNDKIIHDAIEQNYEKVFFDTVAELNFKIQEKHKQATEGLELVFLYKALIKTLQYDYGSMEELKKVLNHFEVLNPAGSVNQSKFWMLNRQRI